jgi:hypothetical protein
MLNRFYLYYLDFLDAAVAGIFPAHSSNAHHIMPVNLLQTNALQINSLEGFIYDRNFQKYLLRIAAQIWL